MKRFSNLSECLKFHCGHTNKAQDKIAEDAGVPVDTFANWVKGKSKYPQDWQGLLRVADVLALATTETQELFDLGSRTPRKLKDVYDEVDKQHTLPALQRILNRPDQAHKFVQGSASPFLVPFALPYFIARPKLQEQIARHLFKEGRNQICLVGMGGVGKSTLAIQTAHLLRDQFPDGVLWARLDKAEISHVLTSFARAYGEDVSQIEYVESKANIVRSLLADKHALMILDNVNQSSSLELLLPSTRSWMTIVTTRENNIGIVRRHFTSIEMAGFEPEESRLLFHHHLTKANRPVEDEILDVFATSLSNHPLAIDIVASRLQHELTLTAPQYLAQLQQSQNRIDHLRDEQWDIRALLQVSYAALSSHLQQLFKAISLFQGESFGADAAAFMLNKRQDTVERELGTLCDLSLLQRAEAATLRYQLHPLLRDLGRELMPEQEPIRQMVIYFQQYIALHQGNEEKLQQEHGNIIGAIQASLSLGMSSVFIHMSNGYYQFLKTHGFYTLAQTYLEQSVALARELQEWPLVIDSLRNLGELFAVRESDEQAEKILLEAWNYAKVQEDDQRLITLTTVLGSLYGRNGNYEKAIYYLQLGKDTARFQNDDKAASELLMRLSSCAIMLQQYEEARSYIAEGLEIARQQNNLDSLTQLLTNRGEIAERLGDHRQAREDWNAALEIARLTGYQERICNLVANLGQNFTKVGRYKEAKPYLQEALTIATQLQHRWHLPSVWSYWGEWYLAQKLVDNAAETYQTACELPSTKQFPEIMGEVKYGMARIAAARNELERAESLAKEALAILTASNPEKALEVKQWLNRLSH